MAAKEPPKMARGFETYAPREYRGAILVGVNGELGGMSRCWP